MRQNVKRIDLNGMWRLCGRSEHDPEGEKIFLRAKVPGVVQLDLSREGYLPADLFMGENILETEKYESYEWWYETEFEAPDERENVFLVFRGVDTLAQYYLNGEKLGESDNMFIPHEFDIGGLLKNGKNTLTVHISSVTEYENREDFDIKSVLSSWFPVSHTPLRNAPHCYGWDIMPRAVNSGLWRDVYIEVRDEIRFAQTFFEFTGKNLRFAYVLDCKTEDIKKLTIELSASSGESRAYVRFPVRTKAGRSPGFVELPDPKLWWPRGYGEPFVYDGFIRIFRDGELVHEKQTSFGLRTVELQRSDVTDGKNGYFRLLVNGKEILCKGSNWVPLDAFHSRDAERYEKALALVKDVGCNIVRCWGGNVYEDHAFFDFCDRNGIMVWQDFAMACNSYPQNEDFCKKIEAEAVSVIREYRQHPSLILWSGDNEIDFMHAGFGVDPSTNRITRDILPRAVFANDSSRPYLASSPYVSKEALEKGLSYLPEDHLWGPRGYYKEDYYKNSKAHFVSETGYHGMPSLESVKKFITPGRLWHYHKNPEWILHSSDQKGDDSRMMLMENQVRIMFGFVPENIEDFILASQITQAEAKKYFIERIRVGRPYKSGIIWWNILDGWPQMSDAVVDYYFKKKLAYEYIKRAQSPFILALDEPQGTKQRLVACNDTLSAVVGTYAVADAESSEILISGDFDISENCSAEIASICAEHYENRMLMISWKTNLGEGRSHYLCGHPPFSLEKYKALMKKHHLDSEINL